MTTRNWEEGYGRLQAFGDLYSHARVPWGYLDEDDFPLGQWVFVQRRGYVTGKISEGRVALLEQLPDWSWQVRQDRWEEAFWLLEQFAAREGHAQPVVSHFESGFALGRWLDKQRQRHLSGRLDMDRAQRLEALGGWTWAPHQGAWECGYRALCSFVEREGHARIPVDHAEDGVLLQRWCQKQRTALKQGRLSQARRARLEGVKDWSWDPYGQNWLLACEALRVFADREGHCQVPDGYIFNGIDLAKWVENQRSAFRDPLGRGASLTPERRRLLEDISSWSWDPHEDAWMGTYHLLRAYVFEIGTADVKQRTYYRGFPLGHWVNRQRTQRMELRENRAALLERLAGWTWHKHADAWEHNYQLVEAYAVRFGTLSIPRSSGDPELTRLAVWLRNNKHRMLVGELTADRARRLQDLFDRY